MRMSRQNSTFTSALLASAGIALCVLLAPSVSDALNMADIREAVSPFLYGMIGFFGAAAFITFGGGMTIYLVRMALDNRVEGIDVMIWGCTIFFIVLVLIGILVLIE